MERELNLTRKTTRRVLLVSLAVVAVMTGVLVWNAFRLQAVEREIASARAKRESLEAEQVALGETLKSLKDAPAGGIQAVAQPVNVAGVVHDFFLWIDVRDLSGEVVRVTYEFAHPSYKPIKSEIASTGFAAYFRGPIRADQPICPGRTTVTIVFADSHQKVVDYDLCGKLGLDSSGGGA
jgi:hypothetical protein